MCHLAVLFHYQIYITTLPPKEAQGGKQTNDKASKNSPNIEADWESILLKRLVGKGRSLTGAKKTVAMTPV